MANTHAASGTLAVRVQRASLEGRLDNEDRVAVEAPLEFQLHHPELGDEPASFGATMRTPGDDEWLAAGLLYGEGIVSSASDIEAIESSTRRPNVVNVRLHASVRLEVQTPARRFSAGSSCGVCGTPSRAPRRSALRIGAASIFACCCACRIECANRSPDSATLAASMPRRCSTSTAQC